MEFRHKNNLVTYYETYGNPQNSTLVLLHGIGADTNMWKHQRKIFSENGYHVIALDLLTHGKSSKMKDLSLYDWSNQITELMEYLSIEKATLIGVSMGGVIAQHFAITYPNKLANLVISDSFGELKSFKERMLGYSQILGFRIFKVLGKKMLAKGMASTYKADYAQEAKSYFQEISLTVDLDQMIIARKAINKVDLLILLKEIDKPSLVMVGNQFGKSFIDINRKISDALKIELLVIEDSMDPSNLVNPVRFNELVLNFLEESYEIDDQ
ncbi:MAG: alpha/beta hydrolase [Spirochaetia bacterium]|nr:alpha/beta hydrolase [Spirochaetia bacterium]